MLGQTQRRSLLVFAALLFFASVALQSWIDPRRHQYEPGGHNTGKAVNHLPIEFALLALTGFREAVAGLLWVRTDEFFHSGDYDAVAPMIRIITWLDPHQTDVYQTGAWHMDYNFTDSEQRSDRRYVPLSLALMQEGIANNPDVPDMYADLGFTHYFRKLADFPDAAHVCEQGQKVLVHQIEAGKRSPNDSDIQAQATVAAGSITTLGHGAAHAYETAGRIDDALRQWQWCIAAHQDSLARHIGEVYPQQSSLLVSKKQLYEMQQRRKWRARDTKVPLDVKFSAQIERVAPRVFVFRGTFHAIGAINNSFKLDTGAVQWGPADGCRINVRLQDADYKMPVLESFSLSSLTLNPATTIMQDSISVRGGKFERKINMSLDPDMYSFTAPRYTLTFWFNPSNPLDDPLNVQDRIGWLGQGLTDARYLDLSGQIPGNTGAPIPGLRMIKKTITLTREDLTGQGDKVFQ